MKLAVAFAVVVGLAMIAGVATGQESAACLGNAGQRTVAPGTTYGDRSGTWLCDPDDPGATRGGWVLTASPVTPTSTAPATPTATSSPTPGNVTVPAETRHAGRGGAADAFGSASPIIIGTSAFVLAAMFVIAVAQRRFFGPRLAGWLEISEEEAHAED